MADTDSVLNEGRRRLKSRGDTLLDSDGETLFAELMRTAAVDSEAAKAIEEIQH